MLRNHGTSWYFLCKNQWTSQKDASKKLGVVKGDAGEIVSSKLQAVSKGNPGISTFTSV
jgi:hypothetical protein